MDGLPRGLGNGLPIAILIWIAIIFLLGYTLGWY